MFDNYSSDNSREIAKKYGFDVRLFGKRGELNDQHYLDVKNHCWKEDRGKGVDYVIVCDADEFVTGPSKYIGPAPSVVGYNMISDFLPKNSVFEIRTGEFSESYSKQAIFNPDAVKEIDYVHGCHKNRMVILDAWEKGGPLQLYHYRQIGGVERLLERHQEYRKRMSQFNRKHRMGYHYLATDEEKIKEFEILKQNAINLW
jgi:glycosyltransferase involved in cell wall biosynthesis